MLKRLSFTVLVFFTALSAVAFSSSSENANLNKPQPAENAAKFKCGDVDGSDTVDVRDLVIMVHVAFRGDPAPDPFELADLNCDGQINLVDVLSLVSYLSRGKELSCCTSCPTCTSCPDRAYSTNYHLPTALEMVKLADLAYTIDGDRPDPVYFQCWRNLQFIQSEAGPDCQLVGYPNTELFVASDPDNEDIVVSFKGSREMSDFESDGQAIPVNWTFDGGVVVPLSVHSGFYCAYLNIKSQLKTVLASAIENLPDDSNPHIYFTGHSLGGALATLAALDLSSWLVDTHHFKRENVIVYSFGAPRSMKPALADYFNDTVPNGWATAEKTDLVPHLLDLLGYVHIRQLVAINSKIDEDNGTPLQTRLQFTNGADYQTCGPADKRVPAWYVAKYGVDVLHDVKNYQSRLELVKNPGIPNVFVGVKDGLLVYSWSGDVQGPCDKVHLDTRFPSDDEWVVHDLLNPKLTLIPKSEGAKAVYTDEFGNGLVSSQPYVSPRPSKLTIQRAGPLTMEVKWSAAEEGLYDYVALYKQNPNDAGPTGHMAGKKHYVLSDLNDTWKLAQSALGGPFWVAYVTADTPNAEHARILRVAGPVN